jgi:pimeloyl-ACP methyl ester carboxylesterase
MPRQQRFNEIANALSFRSIDGVAVRYVESDHDVNHGETALLLSPWPESVFAYEPSWARLAEAARLIAIDLPGFGRSERKDALMSPRAMGEFIIRAADAFGLENPHVVGPDIGTSAALFAAAADPRRLRSIVIGSGATAVPLALGDPVREWVLAKNLQPYRKIGGRAIVDAALATLERYVPSECARKDYLASYDGDRFAESMRYVQAYPAELELLREMLPSIATPVQIIAGRRDMVIPLVNAEYLYQRLPNSELRMIDAGHFVWEDAADEYAALVTGWWGGGFTAPLTNAAGQALSHS